MAFENAQHRRLRRPAGRGRGGTGICAGALDPGDALAAERHAQAGRYRSRAVRVGLPFRLPEELPGPAQGGAVSRVDLRRRQGLSRTAWARYLGARARARAAVGGRNQADLARPAAARFWLRRALSSCAPKNRRADAAMDLGLMPSLAKPSSLQTLSTVSDL